MCTPYISLLVGKILHKWRRFREVEWRFVWDLAGSNNHYQFCTPCKSLTILHYSMTQTFLQVKESSYLVLSWTLGNLNESLTLIWNQASEEQRRMSQEQIISTPPPTHPEWTAAMTGCGHFSMLRNDSCRKRMSFLSIWALLEGSKSEFIKSLPISIRSRPAI